MKEEERFILWLLDKGEIPSCLWIKNDLFGVWHLGNARIVVPFRIPYSRWTLSPISNKYPTVLLLPTDPRKISLPLSVWRTSSTSSQSTPSSLSLTLFAIELLMRSEASATIRALGDSNLSRQRQILNRVFNQSRCFAVLTAAVSFNAWDS